MVKMKLLSLSLRIKALCLLQVLSFVACRHEPYTEEDPTTDTCAYSVEGDSGCLNWAEVDSNEIWYVFKYAYPLMRSPCFNPANTNEFVFLQRTTSDLDKILWVDFVNNAQYTLVDNGSDLAGLPIGDEPQWAKNNQILFHRFDGSNSAVFKINSTGAGLEQLTTTVTH